MTSKKQRQQMLDYLAEKLKGSAPSITPESKEVVSGINSSYILIGGDTPGAVLLVDQVYPGNSFESFYAKINRGRNTGVAVLKDGITFFRSAAEGKYFKKKHGLSLKNYTDAQMHRMMILRPEEKFLRETRSLVQYYQPQSERLQESIISFKFEPVLFDYTHIDSRTRFKPEEKHSERLFVWTQQRESSQALTLEGLFLKDREL